MKSYDLRSLVNTVAITDYTMVSPSLARVIISYTGSPDKSFINNTLVKKFKGLAAPVEASFRSLDNNSAVGYVHLNREVRATNEKQIRASYKVLSKNILMSNEDDSLWFPFYVIILSGCIWQNAAPGRYGARGCCS